MELFGLFWTAVGVILTWVTLRFSLYVMPAGTEGQRRRKAQAARLLRVVTWVLAAAFVLLLCFSAFKGVRRWTIHREEEAVKRALRDAQVFELSFYMDPRNFDRGRLGDYWVPAEQGGTAAIDIEKSVHRLVERRWHYGRESRLMAFEFKSVNVAGDTATAATRERWHLPLYHEEDGSPVKERRPDQEWDSTYKLRKVGGRWLIQETTLPYKRN